MKLLYLFIFLTYLFLMSNDSPPNSLRAQITFAKTSFCKHNVLNVSDLEMHSFPKRTKLPPFYIEDRRKSCFSLITAFLYKLHRRVKIFTFLFYTFLSFCYFIKNTYDGEQVTFYFVSILILFLCCLSPNVK